MVSEDFLMHAQEDFKSGFVALIGRPNAGKSSLLNALMGKKLAITSDTAQTTRHRFRAVLNSEASQIVLVDTPGIHKPHDILGEELNMSALQGLKDVDVIAFLIDASKPIGKGDAWIAEHVKHLKVPRVLVFTKLDLVSEEELQQQLERAQALGEWDSFVALSSKTEENLEGFKSALLDFLPKGPRWFPEDMEIDQSLEVIIAEFIREKILREFSDEIPHAIGCVVEDMEYVKKTKLYKIYAYLYVERDSQKGIIIGKKGAALKKIGTDARLDLEKLLQARVFLDLRVKVRKNWRRDLNQIRRFGYGEGI